MWAKLEYGELMSEKTLFENEVIKEILKKARTIWAISHAMSLMSWDIEVNMPREGVTERSIASSELAVLRQKLILDPELVKLVEKAEDKLEELNDYERGVVRVLKREIRIAKAIPPEVLQEYTRTVGEARIKWREAKQKDNYEIFKPYLAKIVELNRKMADYLGYEEHPYDALLDLREEGLRTRDVDGIFEVLEPGIKRALDKILAEQRFPREHELEKVKYDVDSMVKVNMEILKILEYPINTRGRLDISAHPFTSSMGIKDVRITTRYEGIDFKRSMYAVIHEYGHALYELQIDEKLMTTPIARGASAGVHESQSRFWENIIGRSRAFAKAIYPTLTKHLKFLEKYGPEELYIYFNTVKPSLIRVDADEVTYNLHILLRFKLEKLMITGEVKVDELPELWNSEMERLLGVKPKTYREGLLQDIHWSSGLGGFPGYTLGNVIAAQVKYNIEKELGELDKYIEELNFKPIREYLKEKIHKWGATYAPKELIKKSFGEELNPKYFIDYLERKYLK